jgi:methionyl-tRNA synthetase
MFALLLTTAPPATWGEPLSQRQVPPSQQPTPEDEERAKIEKDMAKKANEQRQAELKRDAEKLLKLATELQQYVDKSNEHLLSLEVIKKAEEIEKLAHSVKEKMKGY